MGIFTQNHKGIYFKTSSSSIQYTNGGSEVMTFLSSGNVGIGTTSPSAALHVYKDQNEPFIVESPNPNTWMNIVSSDGNWSMGAASGNKWMVYQRTGTNATRMTIDSNGNVGIGTTSPEGRLELNGSGQSWTTAPGIRMWDSFNSKGWFVGSANNVNAGDFYIRTLPEEDTNPGSSQQEFTIKHATGNVGIGTTSPDNKLHVYGGRIVLDNTLANQSAIQFNHAGTEMGVIYRPGGNSDQLRFFMTGAGDTMTLNSSGNVGIGTTTPSEKLNVGGNILATGTILGSNLSGTNTGDQTSVTGSAGNVGGLTAGMIVSGGDGRKSMQISTFAGVNEPTGAYYGTNVTGAPTADWINYFNIVGNSWQSSNNYSFQLTHAFHSDNFWVSRTTNGVQSAARLILDSGSDYQTKTGILQSNSSLRAPAFYDSDDTGFYLDPDGGSNLNDLTVVGILQVGTDVRSRVYYDLDDAAYYGDFASTSNLNAIKANSLYLDRAESASRGISWYSSSYNAWSEYMSPAGTINCGATANITAPSGSIVTSWAQRTFIENASNYGWTWESGGANGQPSVVAEIRSSDGLAQFNGGVRSPIFYDSDDTAFYGDFASRSVLNSLQLGNASSDTSNLKLDVQGNMAIRSANGLYFGVSSNNFNSWTTRLYANGSTQYFNAQTFIFDNQGYGSTTFTTINSNGVYAPIFYDLDNTVYYVNPAGSSQLSAIYYDEWLRNNRSTASGLYWESNSPGNGWHLYPEDRQHITFRTGSGNGGIKGTTEEGTARGYVHWTTSNEIGFLTNSGSWSLRVDSSGNSFATTSSRAPIFYDSNDTGYYLDPNSISVLAGFNLNSTGTAQFRYLAPGVGTVNINAPFAHNSNTGAINIAMTDNDTGGIVIDNEGVTVYGAADTGTVFRVIDEDVWQTNGNNVSAATTFSVNQGNNGGALTRGTHTATNDFRAPIFYDSNNTAYYLNPASTSQINHLNCASNLSFGSFTAGTRGTIFEGYSTHSTVRTDAARLDFYMGKTTTGVGNVMSITDTGRVGIGTTSPGAKLQVNDAPTVGPTSANLSGLNPILYLDAGNAAGRSIVLKNHTSGNDTVIGALRFAVSPDGSNYSHASIEAKQDANGAADTLEFRTASSNTQAATNNLAMIIQGSNVGIGETNPTSKLHITIPNYTTAFRVDGPTGTTFTYMTFNSGGSYRGSIAPNTVGVTYASASDYRLKENIIKLQNSTERIKKLKPSNFNFLEDPSKTVDGFIAHEVQEVVPEAVTGKKDAVLPNGEPDYQGIDQSKLVPLLTAALQEAITKIEQLETRIQTLENKH